MKLCAFFGHRNFDYMPYCEKIKNIIVNLIEQQGVVEFCSGYRGNFDKLCAHIVWRLRGEFPQIKNTMVLSYIPRPSFELPMCFDDSLYLVDRNIPPRLAILETNRLLAERADSIVSGVCRAHGGAFLACEHARKHKKPIIDIFEEL